MEYETLEKRVKMAPIGTAKLGIENMRVLMHHLGDVQEQLPIVHIAGTNGKGSTAKMTATILEEAGYKVGLFTSPSLIDFNERIQINQQPISDDDLEIVIQFIEKRLPADFMATQFEMFTALAWVAFYLFEVDIVVMEVGLGGRLDATNIIKKPLVSAITKIALDHVHILGDTLDAIAKEKAGIIKLAVPVISYPQADEVTLVLAEVAMQKEAPLTVVDEEKLSYTLDNSLEQQFIYKQKEYTLSLLEEHQILNACVVIEIMEQLKNHGWNISDADVVNGLHATKWAARFERLETSIGEVIIDGSHNVDGMTSLRKNMLRYYPSRYRIGVIGMVADKDIEHVLQTIVPIFDELIVTQPDNHRALSADNLAAEIIKTNLISADKVHIEADYNGTLVRAAKVIKEQSQETVLCLFGSFYFVGNLRRELKQSPGWQ